MNSKSPFNKAPVGRPRKPKLPLIMQNPPGTVTGDEMSERHRKMTAPLVQPPQQQLAGTDL